MLSYRQVGVSLRHSLVRHILGHSLSYIRPCQRKMLRLMRLYFEAGVPLGGITPEGAAATGSGSVSVPQTRPRQHRAGFILNQFLACSRMPRRQDRRIRHRQQKSRSGTGRRALIVVKASASTPMPTMTICNRRFHDPCCRHKTGRG